MLPPPGLIALDLDGTLIGTDGTVPPVTVRSLAVAVASGLSITIITGRALPGLRRVLGRLGAVLLGANPLVGVEFGTRIVRFDGSEQLHHEPLPDYLARQFISGLPLGSIDFVAYYPHDDAEQSVVWVPRPGRVPEIAAGMIDAEVSSGSRRAILARVRADRPARIVVRMRPDAPGGLLGGTWRAGGNLNLLASRHTKGMALKRISDLMSAQLTATVVAGDDRSDAAMLQLVPSGQRIVVGNDPGLATLTGCRRVPAPAGLGPAIDAAVQTLPAHLP